MSKEATGTDLTAATGATGAASGDATAPDAAPDITPIDRPAAARDFDFLIGRWRVRHKRLKERLAGCDTDDPANWTEFETAHECWHILGGLGNVDRAWGEFAGAYYEGVSIRSFDANPAHPRGGEWLIYWMDTGNPAPAFQVRGNFDEAGESGEFFGEDEVAGATYPLRFRWWRYPDAAPGAPAAKWDQAYKLPDSGAGEGKWEVNWVMEFTGDSSERRKKD